MSKVIKTKDYDIFKKHTGNREIDPSNLKKIVSSMRCRNMLELRPLTCDSQMNVIDGQHRLAAAKLLGEDVFYQIDSGATSEDIILANCAQKQWQIHDYVAHYCSRGNVEYEKLKRFCQEKEIGLGEYVGLVKGKRSRINDAIRSGAFKFAEKSEEEGISKCLYQYSRVEEALSKYILGSDSPTKSKKFKAALFLFLKNEDVEFDVLIKKLILKLDCIKKCTHLNAYYCMIRDIYNYRNSNPVGQLVMDS